MLERRQALVDGPPAGIGLVEVETVQAVRMDAELQVATNSTVGELPASGTLEAWLKESK